MSRTKRRTKNVYYPKWVLFGDYQSYYKDSPSFDLKLFEFKKKLAQYHSDKDVNFKEPGPAWFRNLLTERPQRREARQQLRNYMLDPENTEVILNSKDPLDYWT